MHESHLSLLLFRTSEEQEMPVGSLDSELVLYGIRVLAKQHLKLSTNESQVSLDLDQ